MKLSVLLCLFVIPTCPMTAAAQSTRSLATPLELLHYCISALVRPGPERPFVKPPTNDRRLKTGSLLYIIGVIPLELEV